MIITNELDYYAVLEVAPDASPHEIRLAYTRAKTAYRKDSVALYSLMSEAETETLLAQIEEAYATLSNPNKRREYDRLHEKLGNDPFTPVIPNAQVFSIDRSPPMDVQAGEDLLNPPATDFSEPVPGDTNPNFQQESFTPTVATQAQVEQTPTTEAPTQQSAPLFDLELETEWHGSLLKKIRESKRIALEDISEFTKINKNYLNAIENEQFDKLPAAVFLRGFVLQLAKYLKLPHEKVVAAYISRAQVKAKSATK